MTKLLLNDKPIAHGYTAGGACILIAFIWAWIGAFNPMVISGIYL